MKAIICDTSPEKVMDECGLMPGELDLLVGGPPCQSYSTAGQARDNARSTWHADLASSLKYVEVLQPKFFVMENVRGLISAAIKHRSYRRAATTWRKAIDRRGGTRFRGSIASPRSSDMRICGLPYGLF